MQYPLTLSFKLIALAPQIFVRDAGGTEILYVKQKLLKLKESVRVFADSSQARELFTIQADRILDWSARYTFRDSQGLTVGSMQRRGARSLWKATYEVADAGGRSVFLLQEENPWIKVLDGLLEGIPVLGGFTGYFFNPKYALTRPDGRPVLGISKHRSFLESRFEIVRHDPSLEGGEETAAVLAVLMMTLLERDRG